MRRLAPLLLLAALAGCDLLRADAGSVRLTTDRAAYTVRDTLTLRLTNGTRERVRHGNLGCATLERYAGDVWLTAAPGFCTEELVLTSRGQTSERHRSLAQTAPGRYRFVFATIEPTRTLMTRTFTVAP